MKSTYLRHHGILGMKWGVRRYQNKDGSLTKAGLARYDEAESNYNSTKADYKAGKKTKKDVRIAKNKMSKAYDQLKKDDMADKGKNLYQQGKTIRDNNHKVKTAAVVAAGSLVCTKLLMARGDVELAYHAALINTGALAVTAILGAKAHHENKNIRAYYSHSRPKE